LAINCGRDPIFAAQARRSRPPPALWGVIGIEVCPRELLMGGVLHLWFGGEGHGFDVEPGDQFVQAPGMAQWVWRVGGARAVCESTLLENNQFHASSTGLAGPLYARPLIRQNSCLECGALAAPSCAEDAGRSAVPLKWTHLSDKDAAQNQGV